MLINKISVFVVNYKYHLIFPNIMDKTKLNEKLPPTNSTKEEKCFVCGLPDSEDHKNLRHEFSTTELIEKKPTEMSSS